MSPTTAPARSSLPKRVVGRLVYEAHDLVDKARGRLVDLQDRWPCTDRKYLLVGCESSGTTAVADLLFVDTPGIRFFREGSRQSWAWEAYKSIYQGRTSIRDYPRLQLYDAIKVPGFATIIRQFREGFPNTRVIYVVRDPRDFVSSTFRTWHGQGVDDPFRIPWVAEDWLGLPASDPVERLCLRWKAYLEAAVDAGNVSFVRYEDFTADKVGVIRELARQLELPFNAERVDARKDKQIARARRYVPRGPGSWQDDLTTSDVATIERLCVAELERWRYLT